ncbi:uroporphyrinogen-III synthase [Methylicorpusculum sp.]|uniref:uroporphyrinogen-III synthase n=1 Tax=Methylicorpusculum sp. TaxID=2713644 RepID=UPI002731324C|nr:uroporphyrinogen-III synthase [Methylicorpusculum sp.]MDP2179095.1 uroporphyrinogen-III synthase [Methylicorpusculum sp.]MDP3530358.1 uroporphyrinogen-III synthase [Methylicorpusculum sp.]MDZ4153153.1 uroporphyrinogen-III synthase [Methylicorpusculum sp.]
MNRSQGILITRPVHQAEKLCGLLSEAGFLPIRFPVLDIVPTQKSDQAKQILARIDDYDRLIFISVNAVNFALLLNDGKIAAFTDRPIAAVGASTADALVKQGLLVDTVPESGFNTEALLAMPQLQAVKGQRILIIRGEGGREALADELRRRGAAVDYLEVYQRACPDLDNKPLTKMLQEEQLAVITVTSSEGLNNLVRMMGDELKSALLILPLVVVSERMAQDAQARGFFHVVVAKNPSDAAILEEIKKIINGEYQWLS